MNVILADTLPQYRFKLLYHHYQGMCWCMTLEVTSHCRHSQGLGFTTLQSTLLDAASSVFQIGSLLVAGYTHLPHLLHRALLTSSRCPKASSVCASKIVSYSVALSCIGPTHSPTSAVRVITQALGNITCIIAAACLIYLPDEQKWNRLIAYWFTTFQVSLVSSSISREDYRKLTYHV